MLRGGTAGVVWCPLLPLGKAAAIPASTNVPRYVSKSDSSTVGTSPVSAGFNTRVTLSR